MRVFQRIAILIFSSWLINACVSSVENPPPEVDSQKALEAHIKLGMNYLQRDDRDRAQRAFAKAQEIDERSAEAMQGVALVHQLNGETDLADKKFKKALKLRSDFSKASIQVSYARFLYSSERYSEAIELLENAGSDINYQSRENALYLLGLSSLKIGDAVRAKGAFEHALNINSQFSAPAIELAELSFAEKNYPLAKKYLDIFDKNARQSARSLWLGIRLERIFENKDKVASYALALKNLHPYSKEYLEYKDSIKNEE